MDHRVVNLVDDFKAFYAVFGVMLWEHNIPEVAALMAKDLQYPTCNIGVFRADVSRYEIYVPPIIERTCNSKLQYVLSANVDDYGHYSYYRHTSPD